LTLDWVNRLIEFRLESGLPVWRYQVGDFILEKRILLPNRQNTVHLTYQLFGGDGTARLRLRPFMNFRAHEARVDQPMKGPYQVTAHGNQVEVQPLKKGSEASEPAACPPLRMFPAIGPGALVLDGGSCQDIFYRMEFNRGYEARGEVWTPGYFRFTLQKDQVATLIASTEDWETILALDPEQAWEAEIERRRRLLGAAAPQARQGPAAQLVLAADQFIIAPTTRIADIARAQAAGDELRTIIAGYHWFTDWGRDTMISLEGLTLTTGRATEAGYILRTFAQYIKDGLIPNLFPEGEREGLYHTADATLWYFHALHRYLQYSGDRSTLKILLPKLIEIFRHHVKGTRFGIQVDPRDGLLSQGAEGYQLTWMDAKVGDWVVTPRRGKAVEINALWYNALRLLETWVREEQGDDQAEEIGDHAEKARNSFNQRFWYQQGQYLFDVVDGEKGDDASLRPNQLLAISLDYPVVEQRYWKPVLDAVTKNLLTPVGLRSLAPQSPDYKARYDGDLRARDAAYHQGTVWAWLVGPFIDAWLRLYPNDSRKAFGFLEGVIPHLHEAGVGTISEVFDAEEPFMPRGCIAQAWSVAEVLRCLVKTGPPMN
jgi:predicted glycogen debranching enzyme